MGVDAGNVRKQSLEARSSRECRQRKLCLRILGWQQRRHEGQFSEGERRMKIVDLVGTRFV